MLILGILNETVVSGHPSMPLTFDCRIFRSKETTGPFAQVASYHSTTDLRFYPPLTIEGIGKVDLTKINQS